MEDWMVYVLIAVVAIGTGLWLYRKEITFSYRKKEARGIITNWMSTTEKGKRYFYPMIEFETAENGKITFRADDRCEGKPIYDPGTAVTVRYLPGDVEMRKVVYP